MRAIRGYEGGKVTRHALQMAALTFVRPGELRAARWDEFAFDLTDPPKGKTPQASRTAMANPRRAHEDGGAAHRSAFKAGGHGPARVARHHESRGLPFPERAEQGPRMSENTINAALRGMGFTQDQMTGHGFRHMASTLLHERGYRVRAIERQLAHGDSNGARPVQLRRVFARASPDDAGMGRLSGRTRQGRGGGEY